MCQYNAALMATIDPATTKRRWLLLIERSLPRRYRPDCPFTGHSKTLPLAGDASNRRYFRIELSGNASAPSFSCSWLSRKHSNNLKRP